MGYTQYEGMIELDKPLDEETYTLLRKLCETRRMKRKVDPIYGVEGEYYVDGGGDCGQEREDNIIDYNHPPSTQPNLWCHWAPSDNKMEIEWDGEEKFEDPVEWMTYLIDKILAPKGYVANGCIEAQGYEMGDVWWLHVEDNIVRVEDLYQMRSDLSKAKERLLVYETPTQDLPLLANHTWVAEENEDLYKKRLFDIKASK